MLFTCTVVTTYQFTATAILWSASSFVFAYYVRLDNIEVVTPDVCCCTLVHSHQGPGATESI
jgi:hypothetical protein